MLGMRQWLVLAWLGLIPVGCGGADTEEDPANRSRGIEADHCIVDGCICASREDDDSIGPVPPDELGNWAAAYIALPEKPFVVESVVFALVTPLTGPGHDVCSAEIPTRVIMFTSDATTPPDNPEILWDETIEATPVDGAALTPVDRLVTPQVTVEEGQELFVAIQMDGTPESFACVYSCKTATVEESDASWWSTTNEPPFMWASLTDFGLTDAYQVGVTGRSGE